MQPWRLGHRPGLDGLRGVAILLVVAAHVGNGHGYRSAGPAGVTLFFTLSGFLITALLLDRDHDVSLRRFYERRARRLLPALGTCLLFVAVIYVAAGESLIRIAPAVFYVANWYQVGGYSMPLLAHTWSLAIEEQFYILWPLVLIFTVRRSRRMLLWATAAGAVASFALRVALWDGSAARQDRIWFGTDTNAFALLAGCALALWLSDRATDRNRPRVAGALAAVLVVSCAHSTTMSYTFVVPLLASVAGVAMIWSLCGSGPAGVLGAPWLRYVGRRSYAYYLWHLPLLLLLRAVMDDAVAAVFAVGLTAAIGEISWRLVEARWLGAEPRHPRAPVRAAGDASPTPIAS